MLFRRVVSLLILSFDTIKDTII